MNDSRTEAGNMQNKPGVSYSTRKEVLRAGGGKGMNKEVSARKETDLSCGRITNNLCRYYILKRG